MNLLDATVTAVLTPPHEPFWSAEVGGCWLVGVEYDCWGHRTISNLWFKTKEEAQKVDVGYEFLT